MNKDKFTFDPKKHVYTLDGKALTGTTTVLGIVSKGDGLIQWSANEAVKWLQEHPEDFEGAKTAWKKTRDKAGTQGTDVHKIIEEIVKDVIQNSGGMILSGKNPNPQVQNFIDWAIYNKVKFLESEKMVYSRELWLGGTCDLVMEINGEVYLGDIKTAKEIYPINYWQMSAYQFCLQEMGLYPKIKGYKVIRCGKDGTFEVGENFAYEDNIEGFKAALTVYRKLQVISK